MKKMEQISYCLNFKTMATKKTFHHTVISVCPHLTGTLLTLKGFIHIHF